MNAVVMDLTKE